MRRSLVILCAVTMLSLLSQPKAVLAQGFGGFGLGNDSESDDDNFQGSWDESAFQTPMPTEKALTHITIAGTAELRIVAEEIRVVMAIATEGKSAEECKTKNAEQVQAVLAAWKELKIPQENIVSDFISVLPVYEWHSTEREGKAYRIQKRTGYRMQTNLHVAVKTEAEAMTAIDRAFEQGVTDIVTFDYWSSKLDEAKEQARAAAVQAAKKKADTLLAVFDSKPPVINVQEKTAAFFPNSLYRTYEGILEETIVYPRDWHSLPSIKAYRPKMTFYHGLKSNSDTRPQRVAMRPEISVISTVEIIYQSPATKEVVGTGKGSNGIF